MNLNTEILEAAGGYLGIEEWPGARHNPAVVNFARNAGSPQVQDETPRCAAFLGAVLVECNLSPRGNLAARSYERWGRQGRVMRRSSLTWVRPRPRVTQVCRRDVPA